MDTFQDKVFSIVKKIPRGKVLTYGEVAKKLGDKNLARTVGSALNKNRDKLIACHRVIRADGRVGGFNRGTKRKSGLLKREGVRIRKGRIVSPLLQRGIKGDLNPFQPP
ncbi:MAG: hypothetical protein A3B04_00310, partial [Candidatus Portnoybacteria bacterium RIFCSPLOWO2_02_FULL_39_11]